jgi:hypothetical protein
LTACFWAGLLALIPDVVAKQSGYTTDGMT